MDLKGGDGGDGGAGGTQGGRGGDGGNVYVTINDFQEQKLEQLRGKDLEAVRCDVDAVCLPNTRQSLLRDIKEWVTDVDGKRILWLYGTAGSGKSTVANTIASHFKKHLGASFRFNRHAEGRNTPHLLFRNIAYQLAHFDDTFKAHLLVAIKKSGTVAPAMREQFQLFIAEPLNEMSVEHPALIVIDALDECGEEMSREEVLKVIAEASRTLPTSVKILLTSRNERDIVAALASVTSQVNINEVDGIDNDIRTCIDHRMNDVMRSHSYLGNEWPGAYNKQRLTDLAGGLFIWVTVASKYMVQSGDPKRVLADMLAGQPHNAEAALDRLYLEILRSREITHCTPEEINHVVGSILAARTSLTREGLDSLLGLGGNGEQTAGDTSQIRLTTTASVIKALGPILVISDKGMIRFLHASIIDFLTNTKRCTPRFFIDRSKYNHVLTIRCFKTMNILHRDICRINNPTKLNSEVVDLDQRLDKYLMEHLRYACVHWRQHVEDIAVEHDDVYDCAKGFFFTHLLHWIEVMSLLNSTNQVLLALDAMKSWFRKHTYCEIDVRELIDDAFCLMQRFHKPISESAAHVYISAVPLTPPIRILFQTYAPKLENTPKLVYGGAVSDSSIVHQLEGPYEAALSPDCSSFVYARDGDRELFVWDVVTCALIRVLGVHQAAIRSIAFSRDGGRFCSLDAANRIIVWNAINYKTIGVPIQLSSHIWQVGFCGDKIVVHHDSASLCVWDVTTGMLVKEHEVQGSVVHLQGAYFTADDEYAMEDKQRIVKTMTGEDITGKYADGRWIARAQFSPDNTRVLVREESSSRLLDVDSGNIIGDPITHGQCDYAADGKYLIAHNGTSISIFDIGTGKLAFGPFKREGLQHADLSLDGTRLLTRADHQNIEVLDVPSGEVIATLPAIAHDTRFFSRDGNQVIQQSHNSFKIFVVASFPRNHIVPSIVSITPSPAARQLLFLLSDNTLRLALDISTKPVVLDGAASPAVFSPDGSKIVSAYSHHKLQIWDSKDAKPMGKPLRGHRMAVTAVAFSPNGSSLISASFDGTIRIWSATPQRGELYQMRAYSDIRSISLSSDELIISCVSRTGAIQMLDARTGHAIGEPSKYNWCWTEFLPDVSKIICMSSEGHICLTDLLTGQITRKMTTSRPRGITEAVFSPTKIHFLSVSQSVTVDLSDKAPHPSKTSIISHTVSSNGRWLLSVQKLRTAMFRICMWDAESKQCIWGSLDDSFDGPSVAISHSGNKTAIWSFSVCQVHDTSSGKIICCWSTNSEVQCVAFSPDEGQIIAEMVGGGAETWDIESGTKIFAQRHDGAVGGRDASSKPGTPMADSCDGTQHPVAREHWTLTLHNIANGTDRVIFEELNCSIRLPTFSSEGSKIATLVSEELICVWDTSTGHLLGKSPALKHAADISSLVFSPDGNRLLIHFDYYPVQMWNIHEEVNSVRHFDNDNAAAFFPNGSQLLTASPKRNEIRIWDITSSTPPVMSLWSIPETTYKCDLAISPDGTKLLSPAGLWDTQNFQLPMPISSSLGIAKFSPDSKHIGYANLHEICIHDVATGAKRYQWHFHNAQCLFFLPDSSQVCVLGGQGDLLVIGCLPTSIDVKAFSCVYPPDGMMMMSKESLLFDGGWYRGLDGTRLIKLPDDMTIWLATDRQVFGSRYLILGRTINDVTILDMEDYLREFLLEGAWRDGGLRCVDYIERERASALASAGLPNYAFGVPYLEAQTKSQQDQPRPNLTNKHYNYLPIWLRLVIPHLHIFYGLILHLIRSSFGLANRTIQR